MRTPGDIDPIDPFDPTEFVDGAPTAPPEPAFELGPGTIVGDYEIEAKIGEGGMGMVFSAVHPIIGKRAAIKVLKRELCTDRTELARFIDEARAVNKIGHPNIVDIFTLGQLPDGRSYLVMEWLAGEPLRARLARGRPELDETCYILRSLARALDAAHEKGIVHRDLKPDNVFLLAVRGDRPMVKLLDFGIAKLLHPDHRIDRTATNQMMGTPLYIAPEQARADGIAQPADIYALGAMTFEMIAGHPPFGGKSVMEVVAKHMLEKPPRLSSLLQGIPAELDELVDAMLAKEPEQRPTLADFVAVLDRLGPALQPGAIRDRDPRPSQERLTAYTMSPNTPHYAASSMPASTSFSSVPAFANVPSIATQPGHAAPAATLSTAPPDAAHRRWVVVGGIACAVIGVVVAFVLVRGRTSTSEGASEPSTPAVAPTPLQPAPEITKAEVAPAVAPPAVEPAPPPAPEPAPEVAKTSTPPAPAPVATEPVPPATPPPAAGKRKPPKRPDSPKPDKPKPEVNPTPEDPELMAPGSLQRKGQRR